MTVPSGPFNNFPRGKALLNGADVQKISDQVFGVQNNVVAFAGGGKTSATQITACSVEVRTAATAADSVKLPPGQVGLEVFITNNGASSIQVFGSNSDTINNVATGTGVAQANGVSAIYKCLAVSAGSYKWYRVLSA